MLLDRLAFSPLFCLFLPSFAWVYGGLSSKYSALVCDLTLLCVHCGVLTHRQRKQTQRARAMLHFPPPPRTVFFFFSWWNVRALSFLLLWTLRDTFKLNFVTFYGNQMGCLLSDSLQTPRAHNNTPRSRGACNWKAWGDRAQCGPDTRPETRKADQHPSAC